MDYRQKRSMRKQRNDMTLNKQALRKQIIFSPMWDLFAFITCDFFICLQQHVRVWIHVNFDIRTTMTLIPRFIEIDTSDLSSATWIVNGEYRLCWTIWTWQQFYVNFLRAAWQGVAQYSSVQYNCTVINMERGMRSNCKHRPTTAGRKYNVVSCYLDDAPRYYIIDKVVKLQSIIAISSHDQ